MKYLVLFLTLFFASATFAQIDSGYVVRMANEAGIKRPVPGKFAGRSVRVPISMDSFALTKFHTKYIRTMTAGTVLLSSGVLLVAAHIFVVAFVPHYNRNAVIATAAIGVSAMSPGSLVLPIGTSFRHRYKKSLRIALAQKGF
jgi:hypothetical protein